MSTLNVMLFDVDGVLVEPRAYRISIRRTLEVLLGSNEMLLEESEISYFESRGVHVVWDITNIVYALLSIANGTRPGYKAFADELAASASRGLITHFPLVAVELLNDNF